jgi:hypothetical protein
MVHEGERLHRPDPPRDRPIRDFPSYARNNAWGPRDGREDPVSQGVRLGYSVLDEQMREGQRLAERLRGGLRGQPPADLGALIERALNIYRDIGALAFAATEALARNTARAPAQEPPPPPRAAPGTAYAFEVKSSRRVGVKLDLRPGGRPQVGALQALNGAPAIAGVGFKAGALQLEIADDQPDGVYNAVVVDADSGEPLGTLTVRIPA